MIGQEHITRTLKNQIRTGAIGHAYLFSGARGIGKTSAAKIFARAVNCTESTDGSPCLKCANCINYPNIDILEIDAASNNRVEEIRELRDKVKYPPVNGKFKVYIIDEVHMLSDSAFNALLKTLEEPPDNVVFILATTEVQKLPATILSRCMRFDFRLPGTDEIKELLAKIFAEIKADCEPSALSLIARLSEGGVRDALSIADMCLSFATGRLTYTDVLEVTGGGGEEVAKLTEAIVTGDSPTALKIAAELGAMGKNIAVLCKDVAARLRMLGIAKITTDGNKILQLPDDKYSEIATLATQVSADKITAAVDIFVRLENDFRYGLNPQLIFENAALKACLLPADLDAARLQVRVSDLEKRLKELEVRLR